MTAQVSEQLKYKDQTYAMCTEPLSLYLKHNPEIQFDYPHTACWRGYIGTWELKQTNTAYGLYLTELMGYKDGTPSITLKDVFPDNPHGVFAHWFSGEIRCPMGEQLKYVHMGYCSIYEKDLLLEIKQGLLISEKIINHQ